MTVELDIHLTDLDTGKVNRLTHWTQYNIVHDLKEPGSTFHATLAPTNEQRSFTAHGGQRVQVFSYGALQCTAYTDERSEATNKDGSDLTIAARGAGGLLLDSCVDSKNLSVKNKTLLKVANDITTPWQPDYITSVVTNNAANRYVVAGQAPHYVTKTKTVKKENALGVIVDTQVKERVNVGGKSKKKFGKNNPEYRGIEDDNLNETRIKPDEKVWDVILRYSKQIACLPFVGADNTLIITRPCYDMDPAVYGDGIVQKWDAKRYKATGGNVITSQFETSIASRHSEIIAWATGKPNKTSIGRQLLKHVWSVKDPSPAFWKRTSTYPYLGANKLYKPSRQVFKNINNEKLIRRRCRTMFEDAVINAFSLEYKIAGHYINGNLPVVDSMINLHDERYNLIGTPYYIIRVERQMGFDGRFTVLKLIPPRIWLYLDHDKTGDDEYTEHMVQRVFW